MHTIHCPDAEARAARGEQLMIYPEPCDECKAAAAPFIVPTCGIANTDPEDMDPEAFAAWLECIPEEHRDEWRQKRDARQGATTPTEPEPEPAPEDTRDAWEIRRDAERAARNELSAALAKSTAAALTYATGEAWTGTAEDREGWRAEATVTRTRDGLAVSLAHSEREKRYRASLDAFTADDGERLSFHNYRQRGEDIGCNIGQQKDPLQIARDIVRRLLPTAGQIMPRANEQHRQDVERAAWLEETTARFLAAGYGLEKHHDNDRTSRTLSHYETPRLRVELRSYDRTTKIEALELTPEQALAMLATLPKPSPKTEEPETDEEAEA